MTLHLKSRGYPFRPRLLFSCFIVVGVGFPTVYYFRRGQYHASDLSVWLDRGDGKEFSCTFVLHYAVC